MIEVNINRNKEDIEAFIKSKVRSVKALRDLDSLKRGTEKTKRDLQRLMKKIMTTVKEKSNGMFKWAELVFDTISILDTPEEINAALGDAPLKLKEMIHLTLRQARVSKTFHLGLLAELTDASILCFPAIHCCGTLDDIVSHNTRAM